MHLVTSPIGVRYDSLALLNVVILSAAKNLWFTITCIGFEFKSTSGDVDKVLAKSAFFNNDVVEFTVVP